MREKRDGVRIKRIALSVVSALLGAVLAVTTLAATPAKADPLTVDEAREKLQRLDREAGEIGEQYAEAQIKLEKGRKALRTLERDIKAQQKKVDELRNVAASVALTQFQNRNVDTTVRIVTTADPDSFLKQLSTSAKVNDNMNALLQDFQAKQANLTDLRRSQQAEVTSLSETEKKAAELDKSVKARVDAAQQLLSQLTGSQRRQVDPPSPKVSRSTERVDVKGANAKALAAVRYAVARVSDSRYVWGAEGPNSFDCSGLMLAAYRTVGISLPHSSRAQSQMGTPVARANLKPGDLIFYYSPIHHVAMYMGNGKIVHARSPRNGLQINSVDSYPHYQWARRVIG